MPARAISILQSKIEHCVKEVNTGVTNFYELLNKCSSLFEDASSKNQKKKLAELKSEVKKLQRNRDQIKVWAKMNEAKPFIKELNDAKDEVEQVMQKFRKFEAEKNTKEYSERGLDKSKPKEQENTEKWIRSCILKLNKLLEVSDGKIEKLTQGKKKNGKYVMQNEIDKLRKEEKGHRFHVDKLEALLRGLTDEAINPNTDGNADDVKDFVEYYIHCAEEGEEWWCGAVVADSDMMYDMYDGLPMGADVQTTVAAAAASRVVEEPVVEEEEEHDEVGGFKMNGYEDEQINGFGLKEFVEHGGGMKMNGFENVEMKEVNANGNVQMKEVNVNGNVQMKEVNVNGNVQIKEVNVNGGFKVMKLSEIDFPQLVLPPVPTSSAVNSAAQQQQSRSNQETLQWLQSQHAIITIQSSQQSQAIQSQKVLFLQQEIKQQKQLKLVEGHLRNMRNIPALIEQQQQLCKLADPPRALAQPCCTNSLGNVETVRQVSVDNSQQHTTEAPPQDDQDDAWIDAIQHQGLRSLFKYPLRPGAAHSCSYFSFPFPENRRSYGDRGRRLGNFKLLPSTAEQEEYPGEEMLTPREQRHPMDSQYLTSGVNNWTIEPVGVSEYMSDAALIFAFSKRTVREERIDIARKLLDRKWGYHTQLKKWLNRLEYVKHQGNESESGSYYYYEGEDETRKIVHNFTFHYIYLARSAEEAVNVTVA